MFTDVEPGFTFTSLTDGNKYQVITRLSPTTFSVENLTTRALRAVKCDWFDNRLFKFGESDVFQLPEYPQGTFVVTERRARIISSSITYKLESTFGFIYRSEAALEALKSTNDVKSNKPEWSYNCIIDGHEFNDLGLLITYCKHCNADGEWDRISNTYILKG